MWKWYANKFDSLDEKDKLLERDTLPKHTEEEIGKLNSPIYILKIEFGDLQLYSQKTPDPGVFTDNSTKHFFFK